jgi:putative glycerol-1-phosphate prenyltransferase
MDWRNWRHVFKLDPDKAISDEALEQLCESGTDAIMVGGTTGVTYENTVDLLSRIRQYSLPCVLELSDQDAVVLGFDGYLLPVVLNSGSTDYLIGKQHEAVVAFGSRLPWDEIIGEGYIVLNSECAVGKLTQANIPATTREITAYATLAEKLFRLPIVYVEYSGMFGDMTVLAQVKGQLKEAHLIYGGGICSAAEAEAAAAIADTIVVGNIIYEDLAKALETVRG